MTRGESEARDGGGSASGSEDDDGDDDGDGDEDGDGGEDMVVIIPRAGSGR
jgi:hypothetical protein